MTPAQKVERLQALLERIRRKALLPRPRLAVAGRAAEPPAEFEAEEEPTASVPPPEAPALELVAASAGAEPAEDQEIAVDVELLDEDIVDITDLGPEDAASAEAMASTEVDIDVEPPSSSRRPKTAAATMDEALAEAAAGVEEEAPLKTPPPESGRQVALMPPGRQLQQPPPPADLAGDLAGAAAPAVEQVGHTVELPEPAGPALELAPEPAKPAPPAPAELEFIPPPAPPPPEKIPVEIRAPLAARAAPPAPPAAKPVPPAPPVARMPPEPPAAKAIPAPEPPAPLPELTAEVIARPAPPPPVKFIGEAEKFKPQSFLELLDASLGL